MRTVLGAELRGLLGQKTFRSTAPSLMALDETKQPAQLICPLTFFSAGVEDVFKPKN